LVEENKNFVIQLNKINISKRYDQFQIELPIDLNLPTGNYHYYIYQSLIDNDLSWENKLELENGKAVVPVSKIITKNFKGNGNDYSFKIS
jgi:hypothetical protein